MKCELCGNLFNKHVQQGGYVENRWYCNSHINNQPERSKREDAYSYSEFGCSFPVSFITQEGVKTILPNKRYDEHLNEIGDAVL